MKRAHFLFKKPPRHKKDFLYPGYHWALNSLGIGRNRDIGVYADEARRKGYILPARKLPAGFEIKKELADVTTGEQVWQVDSQTMLTRKEILQYYDPIDL